ncbi:MAG TPA: hypothetical protein VGH15_05865 [Caulobacteraceae bacterium]
MSDVREAVVAEARSWVGTPYRHMGGGEQIAGRRLKGVAVDCAQILVEVYAAAGVIAWFSTGRYPHDWMMHQGEERYVGFIERFADEFDPAGQDPEPGDVVVWRFGRTYSHSGIVTAWPRVVHAYAPYAMVDESDTSRPSQLTLLNDGSPRPMRAFRLKGL